MPQQRLYHEYINEKLVPYLYVLTFNSSELNWDKPVFYFDLIKPIEFIGLDHMDDSVISISIYQSELLINPSYQNKLGVHLNSVKNRILKHGVDPCVIQQFVLPVVDLNEVLSFLPNERKMEFLIAN
ncbi:hypothetical protein [Bacillus sp. FJAT-49736]|uniref:hypothetical protein n=1 Tax=Bacillus sp. FJAT-49736 TaxID=2833582 RepID=UPI001BCA1E18|nr:hypothetical protein [Bacillus sp. FJAT-49736]MBS4172075.1 hypothetical protein [Bacillus sp. FJAT-49736]